MTPPLRMAFLGVDHPHGAGWRDLLPHLAGEVELVALVPGFGGAVCSLEEKYAHLPRFATVDDLIRHGDIDSAIVCLPNRETPAAVAALAAAGKHVLVEKPGAATEAEFTAAADAVTRAGVAFQAGYLWRYDPGAERLRAMARDGRFGHLISIEGGLFTSDVGRRGPTHYLFDSTFTGPGGFFNWLMCHWIDLVAFVFEQPVTAVTARVGRFGATPTDVDDGGTAILELAHGAIVTLTGGYWLPRWAGESRWTIRGSQRWVHWDPNAADTGGRFTIFGPQPQFLAMNETFTLPRDTTTGYGGDRGVRLIRDWVTAARTGQPVCRNTVASVIDTLRILDRIYQSSSEGRRVIGMSEQEIGSPKG